MPHRVFILPGCMAGLLLAAPVRADQIDVSSDDVNRPAPARIVPARIVPARIMTGRALDLSGQKVARFAPATASGTSSVYVVSSAGAPVDGVRLIGAPPMMGRRPIGMAVGVPSGLPVRSSGLTSGFGMRMHPLLGGERFHAGIDLAARAGDGVFATGAGRVVSAGWSGGYGLAVTIDHGNGIETRYAHLSRLGVAAGDEVRAGEIVGQVGSTGLSTGPHLHYEMRRFGRPIDPAATLRH